MPRPAKFGERVNTAVRIPVDVLAAVDASAEDRYVSRSMIVEWALRAWLIANVEGWHE
jgi:metal-responsive CopG/Arc/MetJ family transcriptional regulator